MIDTLSNDALAAVGYRVRTPTSNDRALKKAPKIGWHDKCIIVEYPDQTYAVSESGLESNGWALARMHARKAMIR